MATTEYATLAECKTWIGVAGTSQDSILTQTLQAASRAVDREARRRFWIDDAVSTRTYSAEFSDLHFIDDIGSATGLIVQTDSTGDGTFDTTWTLDARTGYGFRLEPANALSGAETLEHSPYTRIRALSGGFPIFHYGLRITALHGWPEVPEEIKTATLMWAARLWKRKDAVLGVAGGADVGLVELARRMDPDIQRAILPYRRLDVIGI